MDALVSTLHLCKSFDSLEVLRDITLDIPPGERVALMGPSGAGKTTLLKIIAGLETPGSGSLQNRAQRTAFVFQESRLIPWRSVKDNLLFVDEKGDYQAALRSVEMEGFADYHPAQLSGGMRQRVNLARALITRPDLLILDEAFRSLDLGIKLHLMEAIHWRWEEQPFTLLCVTHDPKEALYLADTVLFLSPRPAQIIDSFTVPADLRRNPIDANFLAVESTLIEKISRTGVNNQLSPDPLSPQN